MHVGIVSGVTNVTGHIFIGSYNNMIPVAAVAITMEAFCSVLICHTGDYHAQIVSWNNASLPIANIAVTLCVFYIKT